MLFRSGGLDSGWCGGGGGRGSVFGRLLDLDLGLDLDDGHVARVDGHVGGGEVGRAREDGREDGQVLEMVKLAREGRVREVCRVRRLALVLFCVRDSVVCAGAGGREGQGRTMYGCSAAKRERSAAVSDEPTR